MPKPTSSCNDEYLCWNCVGETFLSGRIREKGRVATCSFCSERRNALPLDQVADMFELAFNTHYKRTATGPTDFEEAMYRHGIRTDFWMRDGEPVVDAFVSAAEISTDIAKAIQEILEGRYGTQDDYEMQNETEFDSESHYEESPSGTGEWHELWSAFELELKESSRYFSNKAQETLSAVFDRIGEYRTQNDEPVIAEAGPEKPLNVLYRARVFHDHDKVEKALERPDSEIGPPSARLATAGRMNPAGIAVFYGALGKETALSEVRPAVGSSVVVGKFHLRRTLRLLDLSLLSEVHIPGSIFDPDFQPSIERAKFLGALGTKMVTPVMPSDEAIDYLPTQVVCDYLASQKDLDGIIYKSVQAGYSAKNVVLFHHASRVEEIAVPDGAKVSCSMSQQSDDEDDVVYSVSVELRAQGDTPPEPTPSHLDAKEQYALYMREMRKASETRPISLSLALESLEVHEVGAVSFKTTDFKVTRYVFSRTTLQPGGAPPDLEIDYSELL
jgi:RES domain/HEPN/RES N-terminal domain 1